MSVRRLAEIQPESFDFTPENRAWVDRQIQKYPPGRQASAVMALLRRAQRQHGGWVPKPAIEKIADILEMPYIRVLEVVTFYTMYNLHPVGEHFIQFCGTTPCVLRGADAIKGVLERRIGPQDHISEDGKFSWLEVECLGACCNAPMVQINDDYYEDLTAENFETLLDDLAAGREVKVGSQMGRRTSEPFGDLTSLTTWYGVKGDRDGFETEHVEDDAAVLTAADRDPALDDALAERRTGDEARAADEQAAQDKTQADMGHGGLGDATKHTTARPDSPAVDTKERTADPVGTEQVESSAVHVFRDGTKSEEG